MTPSDSASVEEVRNTVFEFLADQVGVSISKLSAETTLFGDLGIDGDDGVEFLEAFARRFEIDCSNLQVADYFGPEGLTLWAPFYWAVLVFRSGSPEKRARLKEISVGLLVQVVLEGCWPSASRTNGAMHCSGQHDKR